MNKKLQVFVSSTYTDLIEERQAAVQAILDAGHIPAGMELFKAGKSQMQTIYKWIDESDVYMLILGGRYGSIEEESGLSYTELEYKYALSKNTPVFAIVLDDSFLHIKAANNGNDAIFEKENIDKYEPFKKAVKTNIVKFAQNTDQISLSVLSQLNYFLNDNEYDLCGWTKNTKNHSRQNIHSKNNTKVKISTILYDSDILPLETIKKNIKESCMSIYTNKKILLKHLEHINIPDIRKICSESDIIIVDISSLENDLLFLLGYFSALDNTTIFIGNNCISYFSRIRDYCSTFPMPILYEENKASYFTDELTEALSQYIN
ncbi:MAG: DUF4062 domain-containing protein [Bacteroides fragilis]|nr:DUF4062 domain-containing protein [Bacteroides fragilis]